MQIDIVSKNTEVTPDIRDLAEEKLSKVERLLNDVSSVELIFSEEGNPAVHNTQVCEATVYIKGTPLKAHGDGLSFHEALDKLANKLEIQAQKLKSKRVKRYQPRRRDYNNYALIPIEIEDQVEGQKQNDSPQSNDSDVDAEFIKTKHVPLKPMSQEEAALQMDLLAHDFFLYLDEVSSAPAVIYRRQDGHLGVLQGGIN